MTTPRGPAYRIQTPRLVIRCYEPADAGRLKEAVDASIDHLLPWIPWAKDEPQTLVEKEALLRRFRGQFDLDQDYIYGIFDATEARLVGGTGLHNRVGALAREIGYWIEVSQGGQGFATEAAAAMVKVGFELLEIDRLEIHCDPANGASAAVARHLGFTLEATLKRRFPMAQGGLRDSMLWTLFREDYAGSRAASMPLTAYDCVGRVVLGEGAVTAV